MNYVPFYRNFFLIDMVDNFSIMVLRYRLIFFLLGFELRCLGFGFRNDEIFLVEFRVHFNQNFQVLIQHPWKTLIKTEEQTLGITHLKMNECRHMYIQTNALLSVSTFEYFTAEGKKQPNVFWASTIDLRRNSQRFLDERESVKQSATNESEEKHATA